MASEVWLEHSKHSTWSQTTSTNANRKRSFINYRLWHKIHPLIPTIKWLNDPPLMQVSFGDSQDELCFFAGVGFDSLMLNDFQQIKAWSKRTGILTKALSSVVGYCVALVVKTLPKCVWKGTHNIQVKVTTQHADETTWIDRPSKR
jgi:hypothetical protein